MNEEDKSKKSLVAPSLADEKLEVSNKSPGGKNSGASPKTQDTFLKPRERHRSKRKPVKFGPKLNNKKFEVGFFFCLPVA